MSTMAILLVKYHSHKIFENPFLNTFFKSPHFKDLFHPTLGNITFTEYRTSCSNITFTGYIVWSELQ